VSRFRCTFWIDQELYDGLTQLRDRDGMTAAEAIRRALRDFLRRKGIEVAAPDPKARRRTRDDR
jgi:hypothetical protein